MAHIRTECQVIDTASVSWIRPGMSGSNGFWRGPYTSSTTFCRIVAAANVEMNAVISKSTPTRPSSGFTATK